MAKFMVKTDPAFEAVLDGYPEEVRPKLEQLRKLVLDVAAEMEEITELDETLKWGEPSFVTKQGSTFRMDWKSKTPDEYAIYFQCTSRLIPTFKVVFGDLFQYEGNRALVFSMEGTIPETELKVCIETALRYHRVKDMLTLGL